jgi:hypothetical protein
MKKGSGRYKRENTQRKAWRAKREGELIGIKTKL